MNENIFEFAIIGQPNEGKSSLISTIFQNSNIEIGAIAGTTRLCTPFSFNDPVNGKVLFTFFDTPGIQNPREILDWFQNQLNAGRLEVGELAKRFIDEHRHDPDFEDDCEWLKPLARKCIVVYVVDGSRPIDGADEQMSEIIRISGNSRIALINSKKENLFYIEAWRNMLRKDFNFVREFNAHHAQFGEVISFFESVRLCEQSKVSLIDFAIESFKKERNGAIRKQVRFFIRLINNIVSLEEKAEVNDNDDKDLITARLKYNLEKKCIELEQKFRKETLANFNMHTVTIELPEGISSDLVLTDETKYVVIERGKLLAGFAATGATIGAGIDLFVGGLSCGAGAIIGGVAGTLAGTVKLYKNISIKQERGWSAKIKTIIVTLPPNSQFLFRILERAILYSKIIANIPHGNRDVRIDISQATIKNWPQNEINILIAYINAAFDKKKKNINECEEKLTDLLISKLTSFNDLKSFFQ